MARHERSCGTHRPSVPARQTIPRPSFLARHHCDPATKEPAHRGRPCGRRPRSRRNRPAQSDRPARLACTRPRAVEFFLDLLQRRQDLRQFRGLVDLPVLLRGKSNPSPVRTATFVGATERGRRGPCGRDEFRDGKSRGQDFFLEVRDLLSANQIVFDRWYGVLP